MTPTQESIVQILSNARSNEWIEEDIIIDNLPNPLNKAPSVYQGVCEEALETLVDMDILKRNDNTYRISDSSGSSFSGSSSWEEKDEGYIGSAL